MKNKPNYNRFERPIMHLGNKAKMHINNEVVEQVRFLHEKVGHVEWSGVLMLRLNGSISNIDGLVASVEGIYPGNMGGVASTDFRPSDSLDDCFKMYPDWDYMSPNRWDGKNSNIGTKTGTVHTHHSLNEGAYFSNVDMTELDTNTATNGLYVSLIVSMDGKFVAKGAFISDINKKSSLSLHDFEDDLLVENTSEHLVTFDFNIEFDTNTKFKSRVNSIVAIAKTEASRSISYRTDKPDKPGGHYKDYTVDELDALTAKQYMNLLY